MTQLGVALAGTLKVVADSVSVFTDFENPRVQSFSPCLTFLFELLILNTGHFGYSSSERVFCAASYQRRFTLGFRARSERPSVAAALKSLLGLKRVPVLGLYLTS